MLTIGELAARSGVAATALRYYDDLGLVRPAARVGGQRRYDESAVRQVAVVLFLRELGFTLAEVRMLLADQPRRKSTWAALARSKLDELDRLIGDAQLARTALVHSLQCPNGDPATCPTFRSIIDERVAG